ncbi:hypothetical protein BO82DRAFT_358825 [Aspergillus uvarum CBS 121591]|uniref:AA9 family lytic polysaccharide monooxygenase n=1 Tax=Aspergillus uvarum CBS 121591 TaxID=1448315 RepID=A0A319BZ86_9EURO|nr:hypothetical protein BO82DRAFT_358825 [Aspergillus uvarum CBS 121591]PYH76780.1 hypothetical protein BO82DRAFT_358825 [Aspergillus uvarum CBS 121591]
MKSSTFGMLALAAAAKMVDAHTTVFAVWINGEDQGLGNSASGYIRSPPSNSPVKDVTSTDITCNVNGDQAAAKTLSVKGGDVVTFEWHHDSRDASDDIIASSHKGPVMVYMAPTTAGSSGKNWVKIAEDGYSDGTWAVDTLIANSGKHNITVPDVPAGDYLFRPEIIALHEANNEGGAQFYMECVQFKVTSDGANTLPEGVSLPGAYSATDAGILFNMYGSFDSYPIPGPSVWDGTSSGSSSSASSSSSSAAAAVVATSSSSSSIEAVTTKGAVAAVSTAAAVAPTTTAAPTTFATAVASTKKATACRNKTKSSAQASAAATTAAAVAETTSSTAAAVAVETTAAAAAASSSSSSASSGTAGKYERCGGQGWTGATTCVDGWTCKQWNPYYYQCVESA